MSELEMLTPQNSAIALIDYQPAMYQGVQSHDRLVVFNNIQILAKAAKLFKIPTVLTTVAKDSSPGPFMPEVTRSVSQARHHRPYLDEFLARRRFPQGRCRDRAQEDSSSRGFGPRPV